MTVDDFTESAYRSLVEEAASRFDFVAFENLRPTSSSVAVWRHDVDISPQRASAIAAIDSDLGVRSYFFVQLTSRFYSLLEPQLQHLLHEIEDLGHIIGLHFDPSCAHSADVNDQAERLTWEAGILARILGHEVSEFSVHNPTVSRTALLGEQVVDGFVNASWDGWRDLATYCSDSNGYWRFETARSVVESSRVNNIYLLTHPEWWTPTSLDAYSRVVRALQGRSESTLEAYRGLLRAHDRTFPGESGSQ